MLVKCKICGNKIDRETAHKVVVNEKNNYYCSELEYSEWQAKKEIKDNTYNLIFQIFDRKITNTILYKEITELSEIYTYEKIFAYLTENEKYLSGVMGKGFTSEYGQIRYFTAILKNSLADFKYKKEEVVKKEFDNDIPDMKFRRKQKRISLEDFELEVGEEL